MGSPCEKNEPRLGRRERTRFMCTRHNTSDFSQKFQNLETGEARIMSGGVMRRNTSWKTSSSPIFSLFLFSLCCFAPHPPLFPCLLRNHDSEVLWHSQSQSNNAPTI